MIATRKASVLAIFAATLLSPAVGAAQDVCPEITRVLRAGLDDHPPLSSLTFHVLPGARSCDVEIDEADDYSLYVCSWPLQTKAYNSDDALESEAVEMEMRRALESDKAELKKFAAQVNGCIASGVVPVKWGTWYQHDDEGVDYNICADLHDGSGKSLCVTVELRETAIYYRRSPTPNEIELAVSVEDM